MFVQRSLQVFKSEYKLDVHVAMQHSLPYASVLPSICKANQYNCEDVSYILKRIILRQPGGQGRRQALDRETASITEGTSFYYRKGGDEHSSFSNEISNTHDI